MSLLLIFLGLVMFLVYLIKMIRRMLSKRQAEAKTMFIRAAIGFVIFFIGIMILPETEPEFTDTEEAEIAIEETVEKDNEEHDESVELTESQQVSAYSIDIGMALQELGSAFNEISVIFDNEGFNEERKEAIDGAVETIESNINFISNYDQVPAPLSEPHRILLDAINYYKSATDLLPEYLENKDNDLFNEIMANMMVGHMQIDEFYKEFQNVANNY
ncbi:hypothetical protein H1D32_20830 [Anaerobacillus sp. CMMVII]|uniref:hypothetical protein n=1 Tax=Anaerobacillus sp. CMMVII TaxID=2755588 RepID=UPI0021B78479|nr:hypothetical protein [Anaerobacillus sp. CMMVII]MCT8139926.1 hypothetical protein [Anaerobacillus sp. CMMVII]